MNLIWSSYAWEDYTHWIEVDITKVRRINDLIKDARRSPFTGIGKPEPLKHSLEGLWSRRIDREHRLVYRVFGKGKDRALQIVQCRGHY